MVTWQPPGPSPQTLPYRRAQSPNVISMGGQALTGPAMVELGVVHAILAHRIKMPEVMVMYYILKKRAHLNCIRINICSTICVECT